MSIGRCDYDAWSRHVERLMKNLGGPPGLEPGGVWSPPTDVFETEAGVVVKMELPGVEPEDVSIVLVDDRLVVKGKRRDPDAGRKTHYHQMEIAYGPFVKVVFLSVGCDHDRIRATMRDGYLNLLIPRAARPENRKIAVEIKL